MTHAKVFLTIKKAFFTTLSNKLIILRQILIPLKRSSVDRLSKKEKKISISQLAQAIVRVALLIGFNYKAQNLGEDTYIPHSRADNNATKDCSGYIQSNDG